MSRDARLIRFQALETGEVLIVASMDRDVIGKGALILFNKSLRLSRVLSVNTQSLRTFDSLCCVVQRQMFVGVR